VGTLFVLRHAQASLFARDYDELSELGRLQAAALGRHFAALSAGGEIRFDRIVTGPAKRHRDTAAIMLDAMGDAGDLFPAPQLVPGFDEHDAFGLVAKSLPTLEAAEPEIRDLARGARELQDPRERSATWQRLFEAIMERWLADEVVAAGVESWADFQSRVDSATSDLLAQAQGAGNGQRILLVTSVGPAAALLHRATSAPATQAFRTAWRQRNASLSRFLFSQERLTLDAFNLVDHFTPDQITHR